MSEIVKKINSWYVGEDCVQDMISYQNKLTILNKDGILYNHKEGSEIINKYLEDERRKQFPYSNIPTHFNRKKFQKYTYTNQLLEFEQPYICIQDNNIVERYVVKDNKDALLIIKMLSTFKRTGFRTREEIEKLFEQPTNENEKLYILDFNGEIISDGDKITISEEEIQREICESLINSFEKIKKMISDEPSQSIAWNLKNNPLFLSFVEQSVKNVDLNKLELNVHLGTNDTASLILVKVHDSEITIQVIDIYFIKPNYYKVDIVDVPVSKFTLEQLRYLTPKIISLSEPKIPLRLNPGVTREDITVAKEMVRELRRKI